MRPVDSIIPPIDRTWHPGQRIRVMDGTRYLGDGHIDYLFGVAPHRRAVVLMDHPEVKKIDVPIWQLRRIY